VNEYLKLVKEKELSENRLNQLINRNLPESVTLPVTDFRAIEEPMTPQQRQEQLYSATVKDIERVSRDLRCLFYIIENLVWLLWKHVDYYFNRSIVQPTQQFPALKEKEEQLLTQPLLSISQPELEELRKQLTIALTQTQPGQTDNLLNILINLETPTAQPSEFTYYVCRQLKQVLKT